MGAVLELVLRQDFTRVVCAEVCNRWKMMMLSVVFIYRFTVNKMILKYQSGRNTRTNERHDETSEREGIVR